MTVLAAADYPIDPGRPDPDTVVRRILAGLRSVVGAAEVDTSKILGVGIGVSGVVEQGQQVIVHAPALGLCELGGDAVALGAATLPIAHLLAAGGIRD